MNKNSDIRPQNIEAEEAVIASCLVDPNSLLQALEILSPQDFYRTTHQRIFETFQKLNNLNKPVDLVTAVTAMKGHEGIATTLSKIQDTAPLAVNIRAYAGSVKDAATKRKVIETAHNLIKSAKNNDSAAEVLKQAQENIESVVKSVSRYEPDKKQNQVSMDNVFDAGRMIEAYKQHVASLKNNRFITGIDKIDRTIRGVAGGEVLAILARSGSFKTAILQNLLVSYVQNSAWGAVFFSIEMPTPAVTERFIQMSFDEPGSEVEAMFNGKADPVAVSSVEKSFKVRLKNLFVIPTRVSLADIPAYVRLIEAEKNIKVGVVGIDYLGLLEGPGHNAYEVMTKLAKGMKSTAKLLGVPVLVVCQTSRKGGTGQQEISMSMARDSGAVEESADFILGLWQNDLSDAIVEHLELICKILKNRKGPAGSSWILDMDPKTFKLGKEARPYSPESAKGM